MELIPRVGFGPVRLGMTRNQVEAALGPADDIEIMDPEDGGLVIWIYDKPECEFDFDPDHDFRLLRIQSFDPAATVSGETLVGRGVSELERLYPDAKADYEEDGLFDYVDPHTDLSFFVEGGKVTSVVINPAFDETGDEVLWPE